MADPAPQTPTPTPQHPYGNNVTEQRDMANAAYAKYMADYQARQRAAGYSDAQIQAMASPWAQSNRDLNTSYQDYMVANSALSSDNGYDSSFVNGVSNTGADGDNRRANHASTVFNNASRPWIDAEYNGGPMPTFYSANGIKYAGYDPGWNSSMALAKKYQDEVDANSGAFNKERSMALSSTPTGWAEAERLRQNALSMQQKDAGAQQVAGQNAQANDALAAQGGLSSGARERVAEGGAKNYTSMVQGINTNAINNDLNIGTTDEQNKLSMLGAVANEEQARSKNWMAANQYDQGQYTEEKKRLNDYNLHLAELQNQEYAANQQANADNNSGGGSYICTAIKEAGLTTKEEDRKITEFGAKSCLLYPKFGNWYFEYAPKAVQVAKNTGFEFGLIKRHFFDEIFVTMFRESTRKAQREYMIRAKYFIESQLGDCGFEYDMVDRSILNMVHLPKFLKNRLVRQVVFKYIKARVKKAPSVALKKLLTFLKRNRLSESAR